MSELFIINIIDYPHFSPGFVIELCNIKERKIALPLAEVAGLLAVCSHIVVKTAVCSPPTASTVFVFAVVT